MKKLLSIFLLMAAVTLNGMSKPPLKRRLSFEERESPSKEGYGTTPDVGSPLQEKAVKAQLGISRVNIKNFSGKPALIAFYGPSGQMHRLLPDFANAKNKADAIMSSEMNLVREGLFINALPELFRIQVSANKKRLELATLPIRTDENDFRLTGDLSYQAGKVLTIKIHKTENILEPIGLDLYYE